MYDNIYTSIPPKHITLCISTSRDAVFAASIMTEG